MFDSQKDIIIKLILILALPNIKKPIDSEQLQDEQAEPTQEEIDDQNYQDFKYYDERFSKTLEELHSFQNQKTLNKASDAVLKELCNKISVLIFDWNNQKEEFQKVFFRDTLLQGLVSVLISTESPAIKAKILRQSLNIYRLLGLELIYMEEQQEITILSPEELFDCFIILLREGQDLSKESSNDIHIKDEKVLDGYFEILQNCQELFSKKFFDSKILDSLKYIYKFLKNCSSSEILRGQFYNDKQINLIGYFLHFFDMSDPYNQENYEQGIFDLYAQITALFRNLAIDYSFTQLILKNNIIPQLALSIELYPQQTNVVLNTVRLFSKISLNKDCALEIYLNKKCLKNMASFFKIHQENIYIIIRVAFIYANLTGFIEGISKLFYFDFQSFQDLYDSFELYVQKQLYKQESGGIEQFGITSTCWDTKTLKSESDLEALIKITRLIANLLTVNDIGVDLFNNKTILYIEIIKKIMLLLKSQKNDELIQCCLSALSNIMFYHSSSYKIKYDKELVVVNQELLLLVSQFAVNHEQEEICCDALRVLSNLSRHKEIVKQMIQTKVAEAIVLYLESNSKEIVFYVLGALINLSLNEDIKQIYGQSIVQGVTQILKDSSLEEKELINLSLKVLANIIENNNSLPHKIISEVQLSIKNYSNQCELVIQQKQQQKQQNSNTNEIPEIMQLKQLISHVASQIPNESIFSCIVPNCGRKFKIKEELDIHIQKRHKVY